MNGECFGTLHFFCLVSGSRWCEREASAIFHTNGLVTIYGLMLVYIRKASAWCIGRTYDELVILVHETHLLYTLRPEQLTGWKGNNGLQLNQMLHRE
jgi:hypothetical protein